MSEQKKKSVISMIRNKARMARAKQAAASSADLDIGDVVDTVVTVHSGSSTIPVSAWSA